MKRRRSPRSTPPHSRWPSKANVLLAIAIVAILVRLSVFLGGHSGPPSQARNLNLGLDCIYNGPDAEVDIIAVHGLGSKRDTAWRSSENSTWLLEFLPQHIPKSRILLYGYNADIKSHSVTSEQFLYNHADTMILDIAYYRQTTGTQNRPVIFLGHSLGGIMIKSALVKSHLDRSLQKRQVKDATCGVLFFGTPHRGADYTTIYLARQLLRQLLPFHFKSTNDRLLQHMIFDSEALQELQSDFEQIAPDFAIRSFYETWRSKIFLGWSRVIVSRSSAVLDTGVDSQNIPLEGDHRSIVKFQSDRDINFQRVLPTIQTIISKCQDVATSGHVAEQLSSDSMTIKTANTETTNLVFDLPYSRNPRFTGRERELSQLESLLERSRAESRMGIVAIFGTGGMGKTSIVVEYALRNVARFDHIIWISAVSRESILRSFVELALKINPKFPASMPSQDSEVNIRHGHEAIRLVKNWLCQDDNPNWLLVFDNAEDLAGLNLQRDFFPLANHGSLVITSRHRGSGRLARYSIEIGELDPQSSKTILAQSTWKIEDSERAAIAQLAKELQYLPLALDLASSYINQQHISHEDYLQMYRKNFTAVASRVPFGALASWEYRETLITTYELSLNQMQKDDTKLLPCVLRIFSLIGFMDHEHLDLDLLEAILPPFPDAEGCNLRDTLEVLVSYSLIYRVSRDRFSIHPVVQTWVRERQWLEVKEHAKLTTWELLGLSSQAARISYAWPITRPTTEGHARAVETIDYMSQLDPKRRWRLEKMTSHHLRKGWQEACPPGQKPSDSCISLAILLAGYSVHHGDSGHPACGMIIEFTTTQLKEEVIPVQDDVRLSIAIDTAADCLVDRGELLRAIRIRERMQGVYTPEVWALYNDLALSVYYATLNNTEQSHANLLKAAEKDDPSQPWTGAHLEIQLQEAWLSVLSGDSEIAISEQTSLLTEVESSPSLSMHGEDLDIYLRITFDLSLAYLSLQQYQAAIDRLQGMVETVNKIRPWSPDILFFRHYLALAHAGQGHREIAITVLQEVLSEWDENCKEGHPSQRQIISDLSELTDLNDEEVVDWVVDFFNPSLSTSRIASRRAWSSDAEDKSSDLYTHAEWVSFAVLIYVYFWRWGAPAFFNMWYMSALPVFIMTYSDSKDVNASEYKSIFQGPGKLSADYNVSHLGPYSGYEPMNWEPRSHDLPSRDALWGFLLIVMTAGPFVLFSDFLD